LVGEEGASEAPVLEPRSDDVMVGEVLALAVEEGLLGACACHRDEVEWPDGLCLQCLLVAGKRAFGQLVLWAVYMVQGMERWEDGEWEETEEFRSWLAALQGEAPAGGDPARKVDAWLKRSMWRGVLGGGNTEGAK
jgi:hypothetical protein